MGRHRTESRLLSTICLLLVTVNLIANKSANLLFWEACLSGDVWFLERLQFLDCRLKSIIGSLGVEIEVAAVVVESPEG